jgi:DNA-binding NtrC family response regulator
MKRILAVTRDERTPRIVADAFAAEATVDVCADPGELPAALVRRHYDMAFVDIGFLDGGQRQDAACYKRALQPLWSNNPQMIIVALSAPDRIREAVKTVKAGADNYLTYPLDPVETQYVVDSIHEAIRLQTEVDYFRAAAAMGDNTQVVGTRNPAMRKVFEKARLVAPTISTVLIAGETGTGKGVVARLIHALSNRKDGPFVSVHCGAIPDTLIESELFGHEKGAFTGAVKRKLGRFEIAAGGTIFLDEVGTITPPAQIKLLQVLQDKVFQRVGGDAPIGMDARIVAATNIDLAQRCAKGDFRSDLYYRLNVFPIEIPALRDRREDIPLLVDYFMERLRRQLNKDITGVHPSVLSAFDGYAWPGNVRELENLVERAFILETSRILTPESFPAELFEHEAPAATLPLDLSLTLAEFRERAKESAERHYIKELLASHKGRINRSAKDAGVSTRQLHKLMTRHGIRKEEFK